MVEMVFRYLHHLKWLKTKVLQESGGDGGDVLEKNFFWRVSGFRV